MIMLISVICELLHNKKICSMQGIYKADLGLKRKMHAYNQNTFKHIYIY